jgi:predicted deacylase
MYENSDSSAGPHLPIHDFPGRSGAPGRSVYIQGQLHGNESGAMLVLHRLRQKLQSHPPANSVRIVPNANPLGWRRYLESGDGRISANGSNWNRIFQSPGSEPPLTADQLLAAQLWELSKEYDVIIDAHTPEYGLPHVYATDPLTRLLTFDDIPHVFYGQPNHGSFDECHLRLRHGSNSPIASVTVELPSFHLPTTDEVDYWADRLYQEIVAQAVPGEHATSVTLHGQMYDLIASIDGACILRCEPGEVVGAGQPIIDIVSRAGEVSTLCAPSACIPVCFRRSTLVRSGYWATRAIVLR